MSMKSLGGTGFWMRLNICREFNTEGIMTPGNENRYKLPGRVFDENSPQPVGKNHHNLRSYVLFPSLRHFVAVRAAAEATRCRYASHRCTGFEIVKPGVSVRNTLRLDHHNATLSQTGPHLTMHSQSLALPDDLRQGEGDLSTLGGSRANCQKDSTALSFSEVSDQRIVGGVPIRSPRWASFVSRRLVTQ